MRTMTIAGVAAGLLAWAGLAAAQPDPVQVQSWAATCATCHGTDGRAGPGGIPLAGGDEQEMLQKLLDYKNDARPATVMHQIGKGYSDEQLAAFAAWFAKQKK